MRAESVSRVGGQASNSNSSRERARREPFLFLLWYHNLVLESWRSRQVPVVTCIQPEFHESPKLAFGNVINTLCDELGLVKGCHQYGFAFKSCWSCFSGGLCQVHTVGVCCAFGLATGQLKSTTYSLRECPEGR